MLRPMVPGPRLAVASLTYGGKGDRKRREGRKEGNKRGDGDNISMVVLT